MKPATTAVFTILFLITNFKIEAQRVLPQLTVNTLSGSAVNTRDLLKEQQPVVISFWSTICKPCLEELNAIRDQFEEWKPETPFKLVAVAVDDNRFSAKVRAFSSAGRWPATILLDQNQEFKRALNVNAIPQLFLFDRAGNLVYTHTGYVPGSELQLHKALKDLYSK